MPDHGLSSVFKPVKFLGRGGTGDTWLYETLAPTAGVPHLLCCHSAATVVWPLRKESLLCWAGLAAACALSWVAGPAEP